MVIEHDFSTVFPEDIHIGLQIREYIVKDIFEYNGRNLYVLEHLVHKEPVTELFGFDKAFNFRPICDLTEFISYNESDIDSIKVKQ